MKTLWLKSGRLVFLWAVVVLIMTQGCEKNNNDDDENQYEEINDWILENMQDYYLWNTQIPRHTDKSLNPVNYFESLLNKKEDRFSWIQENYTELLKYLSGVTTEAGYDYNLFTPDKVNVIGYITYIKPGAPAEAAGLKRGDFFSSINGTTMTIGNHSDLLAKTSKPHTIGKMIFSGGVNTGQTTSVALSVIEYEENPILLDTIYTIQNKKIGYLVYNFFARDSEPLGIKYEKDLNNLFGDFTNQGIDELIIDLRYNGGGTVITAQILASMISNRTATDIFGYQTYNSLLDKELAKYYGKDYNKSTFLNYIEKYDDNERVVEKVAINKLTNLNKLHLIVTYRSASASELLINCLKPYMDVVLVGDSTYGKNVGSITIYEEDEEKQKTNSWGMQPIISKFENANHFSDYAKGFAPDVEAYELEIGMKPLGDIDELMLSATLSQIFGNAYGMKRKNVTPKYKIIGSSIDRTPSRKNMYVTPFRIKRD